MPKIEESSIDTVASEHVADADLEVRSAILRTKSTNPALQRLKGRLLAEADASEVITSYDRMHHRHNRS